MAYPPHNSASDASGHDTNAAVKPRTQYETPSRFNLDLPDHRAPPGSRLGLGTDHTVEYQQPATGRTLSELIIEIRAAGHGGAGIKSDTAPPTTPVFWVDC